MARNTPSFNFYSADFYSGTLFYKEANVGKYIRLMCIQHIKGHMTIEQMEEICKGPVPDEVMINYIQDDQGMYYNKKLDKIISEKKDYCEKQANNFGEWYGKSPSQIAEIKKQRAAEVTKSGGNSEKPLTDAPSTSGESKNSKPPGHPAVIFKPPSVEEVIEYFLAHGFDENLARRVYEGYEVAEWHDSQGKAIKNWKQKMIQVWFKDEHKTKVKGIDRGQRIGQLIVSGNVKPKFKTD